MKNFLIKCASIMLVVLMLFGLAAPATFAVEASELTRLSNTYNGVRIDFNKVDSASSYNFYRKTAETDWQFIGSKKNDNMTYYVDKDVESGVRYTYKIATVFDSEVIGEVELSYYFLSIPEYSLSTKGNGVQIKIESVVGAESYQILRKDPINNNFTEVGVTKTLEYVDNTVDQNAEYTYAVRAYKERNCSYITSQKIFTYPSPTLRNINSGVKISYQKVDNAVKYTLYKKAEGEDWIKVNEIKPRSWFYFTDYAVVSGNLYDYRVDVVTDDGKTLTGGVDEIMYLEDPTLFLSTNGNSVTVDFTSAIGAERYQIMRRTETTGNKEIGSVDANTHTFVDNNVIEGERYIYSVRVYNGKYCSYINETPIDVAVFTLDCDFEDFIIPSEYIGSIEISDNFIDDISSEIEPEIASSADSAEVPAVKVEFDFINFVKDILIQILEYCITIVSKI